MTHDDVVLKVQTLAPVLHAHHFSNHIWNMSTIQGKNANDNIYITEPSKEHIIYESKPIKLGWVRGFNLATVVHQPLLINFMLIQLK